MKALSIKQPWAWLIASGFKPVENRSWPTNYRGRIYVHAGKKPDTAETKIYPVYFNQQELDKLFELTEWGQSAIIGEVDIVDCRFRYPGENANLHSPWHEESMYGFYLVNPVEYETPIPCRGQLGFFEVTMPEAETEYSKTLRTE